MQKHAHVVVLLPVEGFLYWIFSVKDNFVVFEMNGKYLHRVQVVQKFSDIDGLGWRQIVRIQIVQLQIVLVPQNWIKIGLGWDVILYHKKSTAKGTTKYLKPCVFLFSCTDV